ncbi:DUF5627 domain-containing protein [uncultured Polaribacter sp.]|uniref:DUF5627 domain-containing protein n=1 Tax=uncultured Polaribacter sp. TaxID=174711 RepID=UPI00262ED699|nr:DUF5627 domain-containing protein [uncultured Polaribacter sp.]
MKIKLIAVFIIVLGFLSCENQETVFEDFDTQSVFFPFQTPVRTIVQGDFDLGFNDNDNQGRFEIGVVMSGVVENREDRSVSFELAPELIDASLLGVDTVNVQALPSSYYTIEQESPVIIPSGSTDGRIGIQLNDAFFDDPLSYAPFGEAHYVIPLRITQIQNLDSLLTGIPIVDNPIRINDADWNPAPKDYTLFGIKFINKYSGVHLRRGADRIVGTSVFNDFSGTPETTPIDTTSVYRAEFVVQDELAPVVTKGRSKAQVFNRVRRGNIASNAEVSLILDFNDNGDITVSSAEDEPLVVTGTGRWLEDGDEWGGEPRNVIYLEYEYRDVEVVQDIFFGTVRSETTVDLLHTVRDTLVMRNRDVRFEEFTVNLER